MRTWLHLLDPTTGEYDLSRAQSDDDLIVWPVGIYGEGMPKGVGFSAVGECPACHEHVPRWFEWF